MTEFLERLKDLPLSKQDYILLILANDWIFGAGDFFEKSSLIDPSETNPCIHALHGTLE